MVKYKMKEKHYFLMAICFTILLQVACNNQSGDSGGDIQVPTWAQGIWYTDTSPTRIKAAEITSSQYIVFQVTEIDSSHNPIVSELQRMDCTNVTGDIITFAGGHQVKRLSSDEISVGSQGTWITLYNKLYTYTQGVVSTPIAIPPGGNITRDSVVTLSTNTADAIIYYTIDGSDPSDITNNARLRYDSAISISSNIMVTAVGTKDGMFDSSLLVCYYTATAPYTDFLGSYEYKNANGFVLGFTFTGSEYVMGYTEYTYNNSDLTLYLLETGGGTISLRKINTKNGALDLAGTRYPYTFNNDSSILTMGYNTYTKTAEMKFAPLKHSDLEGEYVDESTVMDINVSRSYLFDGTNRCNFYLTYPVGGQPYTEILEYIIYISYYRIGFSYDRYGLGESNISWRYYTLNNDKSTLEFDEKKWTKNISP